MAHRDAGERVVHSINKRRLRIIYYLPVVYNILLNSDAGTPQPKQLGREMLVDKKKLIAYDKNNPIEEFWPDLIMSEDMQGARVYETEDGKVIARQLPEV